MAGRRMLARRRTAIAVSLSVAGHVAILVLIALDLDRGADEAVFAPPVEITLAPLERITERLPPSSSPPRTAAPPPRRLVPSGVLPSAPVTPYYAPAAPSSAPQAAAAAEDLPSALRTGCVGKRDLELDKRVDCKLEIWSVLDARSPRVLPGDTIPDDKQAKWDAVAARQARQRRPPAQLGNGASMGCPHANLGTGCLDDMLIPLIGSEARESRR